MENEREDAPERAPSVVEHTAKAILQPPIAIVDWSLEYLKQEEEKERSQQK